MAVRVHRELPMAIQEFHAWTLLDNTELSALSYLKAARIRVADLRAMESKLEGKCQ